MRAALEDQRGARCRQFPDGLPRISSPGPHVPESPIQDAGRCLQMVISGRAGSAAPPDDVFGSSKIEAGSMAVLLGYRCSTWPPRSRWRVSST